MPITGTLCKLDAGDGKIKEFLMTEWNGIPMALGMGGGLPNYPEKLAFAVADAVKCMTDNDEITSINIAGVGIVSLAMW